MDKKETQSKIMQNRLDRGFCLFQKEYEDKALEVLRSGWYVLGKELKSFEEEFSAFTGAKYCLGLASGLDSLWIALRALNIGEGDEVIVQGNTYILLRRLNIATFCLPKSPSAALSSIAVALATAQSSALHMKICSAQSAAIFNRRSNSKRYGNYHKWSNAGFRGTGSLLQY